jgi:Transglycosylase-like domain
MSNSRNNDIRRPRDRSPVRRVAFCVLGTLGLGGFSGVFSPPPVVAQQASTTAAPPPSAVTPTTSAATTAPPTTAPPTTAPPAVPVTTAVAQVWSAQVIPTADLGKITTAPGTTLVTVAATTEGTTAAPPAKSKKKKSQAKPQATLSTLVRILPSSTTQFPPVEPSTTSGNVSGKSAAKRLPATPTEIPREPSAAATGNSTANSDGLESLLEKLRRCESGNRYDLNTGNGYYGAYQFSLGTWRKLGYGGYPHQAPPTVQDDAARKLLASSGWGQWPACSRKIGVR